MSFLNRFKNTDVVPSTVKVKFPLDNPELEIEFYRLSNVEMREVYKPMFDGQGYSQADLIFKLYDKLATKIKGIKSLTEDPFEFNKANLDKFTSTVNMTEMIQLANGYLQETSAAEVIEGEKK